MLRDHFNPPLCNERHWTGFHSRWAGNLAVDVNQQLPDGWFAEPQVRWSIEVDVATFEEADRHVRTAEHGGEGAVWEAPSPLKTIGFDLRTDEVEVRVFHEAADTPLVGVVELVSPANKAGSENRDAFLSKCDSYLRDGVGLAVLDMVTTRHFNMHALLMERLGDADESVDPIYVSAYRPLREDDETHLAVWYHSLTIGEPLPSLPLFLRNGPLVKLNLNEMYVQTCRELKFRPTVAND